MLTLVNDDWDDAQECAYIQLHGAAERFMLLLKYRSERNYIAGMEALKMAFEEYQNARTLKRQVAKI
jgi:hypothetical protein